MLITPQADGKCAIEPYLPLGVSMAHITPRQFNRAANRLIEQCVDHHAHAGGVVTDMGMVEDISRIQACYI